MYRRSFNDDTTLVYADPTQLSDTPSLHTYWCGDCGLEFTADDGEHCPVCQSNDVHREH